MCVCEGRGGGEWAYRVVEVVDEGADEGGKQLDVAHAVDEAEACEEEVGVQHHVAAVHRVVVLVVAVLALDAQQEGREGRRVDAARGDQVMGLEDGEGDKVERVPLGRPIDLNHVGAPVA